MCAKFLLRKVLKTPCPASGALCSRGSKERLGSEACTRRPVKERSAARGQGGSLRLLPSLLFGNTELMAAV